MPDIKKNSSLKYLLLIALPALILFSSYLTFYYSYHNKTHSLPALGNISDFVLTDSTGNDFSSDSLKGKVWIADFIFTTCAGPCPIMTQKMGSLYRSYFLEDNIDFVSFTVNPEYDSPKILSDYAKAQNADETRWHFLTGPIETIKRLAVEDFKVGHKDNPIFHSTYLILVDKNGQIRGYYDGTKDNSVKQLFKDTAKLL